MSLTRKALTIAALLLPVAACDTPHAPMGPTSSSPSAIHKDGILESLLHFLFPASNAPALVADTVRFYAVVGQDRHDSLQYHAAAGHSDSVRFAYFDVPAGALVTDQYGDTLAPGDSLQITMYLADSSRMMVGFQPSGLLFSTAHQPTLVLSYHWASPLSLPLMQILLGMYYSDSPGGLWFLAPNSSVNIFTQTVSGSVKGFSVYASSY